MAKSLELADTEPAVNISMRPGGRVSIPWKTILLLATIGASGVGGPWISRNVLSTGADAAKEYAQDVVNAHADGRFRVIETRLDQVVNSVTEMRSDQKEAMKAIGRIEWYIARERNDK